MGFKLRPYIINVILNSFMVSNHEINFGILYPIDDIDLIDLHTTCNKSFKIYKKYNCYFDFCICLQADLYTSQKL